MADYNETELKLYVTDLQVVEQRLNAAGATLKTPRVYETNVRYDDDDNTLQQARQVLRLRRDQRVRLTFKDESGERNESGVSSRYEAEVDVSDFDAMQAILERLGFHAFMIYEKYRTTYALEGAEVTLDEMPYGSFVEIEGDEAAIDRVVERLNLHDARRMAAGYVTLFENVKRHLGLEFQDLTFENFKNVDVPLSAFEAE